MKKGAQMGPFLSTITDHKHDQDIIRSLTSIMVTKLESTTK